MLRLTHYAAALGSLLEAVRASAGPGAALELLRKESLAGLAPTAAAKVGMRTGVSYWVRYNENLVRHAPTAAAKVLVDPLA